MEQLAPYLVTVFAIGGIAFAAIAVTTSRILAPHKPYKEKNSVYECGVEPIGNARIRVRAGYYVYALLFVIFDIETIFLYPWAVTFGQRGVGLFVFFEMVIFIVLLFGGLLYAWKEGALEWR